MSRVEATAPPPYRHGRPTTNHSGAELGIIPFTASVKIVPANGFWVLDDRLVVAEDWHAELWLDDADNIALYSKVWKTLRESAVYGADAHNVINAARRAVNPR